MGVDYYAYAVIGVQLPAEIELPKAKILTRKKAFAHQFDDNGEYEFHPKDGRKLWLDEKYEIEADYPALVFDFYSDGDMSEDALKEGQKLIKLPEGVSHVEGTDGDSIFLGTVLRTSSSRSGDCFAFGSLEGIDEMKQKLKSLLEPIGLWEEKAFGLYSVLYCSY